jgi:uncharacterized protein
MLKLRPNCEYCDKDLPPHATEARICSCGGGFVPRPVRPSTERRRGVSLARHPASIERVHLKWERGDLPAFIAGVRDTAPERRLRKLAD